MARHATRFAGRRRRNNGRAGAARRSLSLSLSLSRGDREGERSGGVRSRSRRLETHSHACRALPPPPIGSSEAIRPVRLLSSLPPGPTHGPDVRREAATSRPFLSIPKDDTDRLSVSLSLFPSSVLLLLSLLVGPHAPQSNATRATANRFPFPEAIGRLPPNNPPSSTHSTVARAPPRRRTSLSRSTCPGPETQVGSWPGRCLG